MLRGAPPQGGRLIAFFFKAGNCVIPPCREVDRDSDGHVSFKDFEHAIRHGRDNL